MMTMTTFTKDEESAEETDEKVKYNVDDENVSDDDQWMKIDTSGSKQMVFSLEPSNELSSVVLCPAE